MELSCTNSTPPYGTAPHWLPHRHSTGWLPHVNIVQPTLEGANVEPVSVPISRIIRAFEELLSIAKVAMPKDQFEIDPRVVDAQEIVALLRGEIQ